MLKSTFRLLVLLISISIGLSSHLPFETFSYKLLKNAENHDRPDLSIKSVNNEFIEAFQNQKTLNLRSKSSKKYVPSKKVEQEAADMAKLTKAALKATKSVKNMFSQNAQYQETYQDLWNFIGKVRLPHPFCPRVKKVNCNTASHYRNYDGSCNNLENHWWGKRITPYQRLLAPEYDDKLDSPKTLTKSGEALPSARLIANSVLLPNPTDSNFTYQFMTFGQFVAHDITRGVDSSATCDCNSYDPDCFNIPVPKGDSSFNESCIPFVRNAASLSLYFNCYLGAREQANNMTHYLDLDNLYGRTVQDNIELRAGIGGLLKSSKIPGSPFEALPLQNPSVGCPILAKKGCFFAGDLNVEQNEMLTATHTVFLREHNRIARALYEINPHWDDERLFQESRRILNAMYQFIFYDKWIPSIIGERLTKKYNLGLLKEGYSYLYNNELYPQIISEFATAAYRMHILIHNDVVKADKFLKKTESKTLRQSIFNTSDAYTAMDDICRGTLAEVTYQSLPQMAESLHNLLFYQVPGEQTISLSAFNIQRGRDHGLPPYVSYRRFCGLSVPKTFDDLKDYMSPEAINNLRKVYKNVNDIELYAGGASEKKTEDGHIGATFSCIQAYQYYILKFGDRFWFENGQDESSRFTLEQLKEIRKTTFSRMLCDNVELDSIPKDAFRFENKKTNPSVKCADLPRIDLTQWSENTYSTSYSYQAPKRYEAPQPQHREENYAAENRYEAPKNSYEQPEKYEIEKNLENLFNEGRWEQDESGLWQLIRN